MASRFRIDDTDLWAEEKEEYFCDGCGQKFLDFGDIEGQPHPWYCASCEDEYEEEYYARRKSIDWFGEDYI